MPKILFILLKCSIVALLLSGCSTLPVVKNLQQEPPATQDLERMVEKSGLNIDVDSNNATDVTYGGTNAATASGARTNLGLAIGTDVEAYKSAADWKTHLSVDDLITLSGVADGATTLGEFTGSTITDSLDIKQALQALETAVESAGALGFDIDVPGASGGFLQSNGTKWERVDEIDVTIAGFTASKMVESDASGELVSSSFGPSDVALATGDTFTGVHDFGGATSVELPNGTGPTVDAAGEVAVDTTSDQFIYYGGAKRVLTYKKQKDFVVKTPADADDFILFRSRTATTISNIYCIAQGGTSISLTIQECDSAGANCSNVDDAQTCDTDGALDDGSLSNASIDAGDWIKVLLGAPTGTVNFLTVSIYYEETAD